MGTSKADVGKHLKVKMIQRADKANYKSATMDAGSVQLSPDKVKADNQCEVVIGFNKEKFYDKECDVLTMDGKLADIMDLRKLKNFSRIPLLRIQQSCQMISLKSDLMLQGPLMVLASFRPSPLSS